MNGAATRRRPSLALACGALIALVFVASALMAPWIARYPPDEVNVAARLLPPGKAHLFGTDAFGRDLFSRVLFGARADLALVLIALAAAVLPGVLLGLLAGMQKGWLDFIFSRSVEVWLSLPALLVAIVIVARFGVSIPLLGTALGVAGLPSFFRLTRNMTISLKSRPFVEAARALGGGSFWLARVHVLPNLLSPLLVLVSLRMGTILLSGSALSFIGLGAQPPQAEWGALLADGKNYLDSAWWLSLFPGAALTITAWGFQMLGDGLRDRFFNGGV